MRKFRKQRKLVGLTQYELSRLTGIPPGRIVFAETGRVRLAPNEIELIKSAIQKRATEITKELAVA